MIINNNLFSYNERQCNDFDVNYEVDFEPNSPGVYCAILGVADNAGNTRYARRCFIFDDQSEVSIVDDNPMHLTVDGETLFLVKTDAWTTGDKHVQVTWTGHFTNQLHIDQNLLFAIEADNYVIDEDYDSDAPPAGRPLAAIANRNGIVKFEVGIGNDTHGGATFTTFEPTWMDLATDLEEIFIDPLENVQDAYTFGFWVRATDIMGNTKSDYVSIHIDSTPPEFEDFVADDSNSYGVYQMTAYDRESGVLSVHWQLLTTDVRGLLSEGYTENFNFDGDCIPTECYCILSNKYCYKLTLEIIPTLDESIQETVSSALLSVTIKNNALLETTQEIEIITSTIGKPRTDTGSDGEGLAIGMVIGIAVGGALLLIILLLVLLILRRKRRDTEQPDNRIAHPNPAFIYDQTCNQYSASNNAPPAYTQSAAVPFPPVAEKPGLDDEYASPTELRVTQKGNITANEIHPNDIGKKGVIVEGNHSVVYKAKIHSIGLTNVAVKSLKAGSTAGEKETILHEIKMIRMLSQQDNIVCLFGFTSIRDPAALIMEYAPSGDLSKYLQQNAQNESLYDNHSRQISSAQLCTYARQVCSGMQHIQRHKIIHRNLGARNILVGDNMVCKITDFGRAVVADIDGTFVETQEIQLPVRWTAVEGLSERLFSMTSDVWSFGVLMWEILSLGAKPYGSIPIKQIAEDVVGGLRLTQPDTCSDAVYSIMETCWHNVPDRRPTFERLSRELDGVVRFDQGHAFDGEEYMGLADLHR